MKKPFRYTLKNGFTDVILAVGFRGEGECYVFYDERGWGFFSLPMWKVKSIRLVVEA